VRNRGQIKCHGQILCQEPISGTLVEESRFRFLTPCRFQDTFGNQLTGTPLMHLAGAAKGPTHDYRLDRKHPVGHKVARRIANSHGLVVDELIAIVREKDTTPLAGTNAHASYLSRRFDPNEVVRCQDLFPEGRVCIFVHRSVFLSDESIVAHLTHELYEIQGIKKAMADAGGFMNARDFHELIREGKRGNLHDLAWDEANRAVEEMRRRKAKV